MPYTLATNDFVFKYMENCLTEVFWFQIRIQHFLFSVKATFHASSPYNNCYSFGHFPFPLQISVLLCATKMDILRTRGVKMSHWGEMKVLNLNLGSIS